MSTRHENQRSKREMSVTRLERGIVTLKGRVERLAVKD